MPEPYRRPRRRPGRPPAPAMPPVARACHNLTHCQFRGDAGGGTGPHATAAPVTTHAHRPVGTRTGPHEGNRTMLDYVIRNGLVVDGTGAPGFRADVGIRDGVIVSVGTVTEEAATELDADGLVVAPGIIDPHTHYDAQLFWDPTASPSNLHGVTTVIAGNCGFTLAPIKAEDHDYIRRMMAKVEGMPLVALEDGIDWDWTTFGEYLGRLEGNLGVNAGFLVGHCAIRRWVMGPDRAGEVANDEELAAMTTLLAESIEAGGHGLLVVAVPHPLRRRREPDLVPLRRPPRDAGLLRGRPRPPGHDARVHHQRLPRLLQRRRDRPHGGHDHDGPSGRSTGTC